MTEATNATSVASSLVSDFNIRKILGLLPHRYPILLVDHVISLRPHESITVIKNVTLNESFSNGHLLGHLMIPGVLTLKALVQTAALLTFDETGHERKENQLYLLVSIDGARFKRQMAPDDQLVMTAGLLRSKSGMWKFRVYGKVDGGAAVEAEIMCAVYEDRLKGET